MVLQPTNFLCGSCPSGSPHNVSFQQNSNIKCKFGHFAFLMETLIIVDAQSFYGSIFPAIHSPWMVGGSWNHCGSESTSKSVLCPDASAVFIVYIGSIRCKFSFQQQHHHHLITSQMTLKPRSHHHATVSVHATFSLHMLMRLTANSEHWRHSCSARLLRK